MCKKIRKRANGAIRAAGGTMLSADKNDSMAEGGAVGLGDQRVQNPFDFQRIPDVLRIKPEASANANAMGVTDNASAPVEIPAQKIGDFSSDPGKRQ